MKYAALGTRRYGFYAPKGLTKSPALVVVHHPGTGSPEQVERQTGWSRLADRDRGLVVIYPEGLRGSWNAGAGALGYAGRTKVDDVGYLGTVLLDAWQRFGFDPKRVYLSGHSNGSMFNHWLAVEQPGQVAAIACVSGGLSEIPAEGCARPPAVRIVHGYDDTHVPFAGGVGQDALDPYQHLPIQQTESWWRAQGGHVEAVYGKWGHVWPANETAAQWSFFQGCAL